MLLVEECLVSEGNAMKWNLDCLQANGPFAQDDDFLASAQRSAAAEVALSRRSFEGATLEGHSFAQLEIDRSIVRSCSFSSCSFPKATFIETEFVDCDFSNGDFSESYFKKCRFTRCKGVGARFVQCVWHMVELRECQMASAFFDETRMSDVRFLQTNCQDASFAQMKLQRFETRESRFIGCDFFRTKLADVDFSMGEFSEPLVSQPPEELRGVRVNLFQAAGLVSLMGVQVVG